MALIRMATIADAPAIAAIYAPYVTGSAITFELEAPTTADFARRITDVLAFAPWLVWEKDGEILGYAYASKHHERAAYQWSVNVGVYLRGDSFRRGIGRTLYVTLFDLLRKQGFYSAHAGITLPNENSVGLHEALGFRLVGIYASVGFKMGAWRDVGWWQLALRERVNTPIPPVFGTRELRHIVLSV